jgi:hypothetical protein
MKQLQLIRSILEQQMLLCFVFNNAGVENVII